MVQKFTAGLILFLAFSEYFVQSQYLNLTQYPGEACNRKCVKGQSMVCYFQWTLEHYHALGPACYKCMEGITADCYKEQCITGDGFEKGVMSINRQIPGPPLHVCEGDKVIVDVINMAHGTSAAIHWHGLHMVDYPYMDGLPYVTQCPIHFESTFRYVMKATPPGTQFYHSHSGHHKLNGQYGALIIRQADEANPQIGEYDYDLPEHYILISDYRHEYAENSFPGLPKGVSFPQSFLINGRGTFVKKDTFERTNVPPTVYYVKSRSSYRMRIMNSGSLTCTVSVECQNHSMIVIATDSYPVEPYEVDTVFMNAGERFDIVLQADQRAGDYWIRVRGVTCQDQPTDTFALLRYINKDSDYNRPVPPYPAYNKPFPLGDTLNHPQATCFDNDGDSCIADLTALEKDYDLVTRKPDYKFLVSFVNYVFPPEKGFIPGKYVRFDNPIEDVIANGLVNNITLILPSSPLLTQYSDVNKNLICDKSNCPQQCGGEVYRECIHIKKVKKDSIVELALYDEAREPGLDHPFHLHGYRFAVMGVTSDTRNLTRAIEKAGSYKKSRPVWKDTVTVPMNGVVVVRFRASNPGIWMLHCHYQLHLATGMAVLIQVGEPDQWVKPPSDFPKCGNYVPGVIN